MIRWTTCHTQNSMQGQLWWGVTMLRGAFQWYSGIEVTQGPVREAYKLTASLSQTWVEFLCSVVSTLYGVKKCLHPSPLEKSRSNVKSPHLGSCVQTLGPSLVIFKNVVEPLGGWASLKEVGQCQGGCWGSIARSHFLFLLCFLTADVIWRHASATTPPQDETLPS